MTSSALRALPPKTLVRCWKRICISVRAAIPCQNGFHSLSIGDIINFSEVLFSCLQLVRERLCHSSAPGRNWKPHFGARFVYQISILPYKWALLYINSRLIDVYYRHIIFKLLSFTFYPIVYKTASTVFKGSLCCQSKNSQALYNGHVTYTRNLVKKELNVNRRSVVFGTTSDAIGVRNTPMLIFLWVFSTWNRFS